MRSGNQIQFYSYNLLGANTNQQAEGTVGSPVSESTTKILATIGQYADYINCSDLSMDVAIDDPSLVQNLATELSYRLGLTLNTLVQLTADSAIGIDSTANTALAAGSYLTAANIRTAVSSLQGINAKPMAGGTFGGVIHPFVVRDVYNDTSFNGLTDVIKRGEGGAEKLMALPSVDEPFEWAGVKFKQSTTAPTVTISNNTYYNTYIFGDDSVFSVFLGKAPEGGEKNYKLMIQTAPEGGSVADPSRVIGGWVAYNTKFTACLRPGTTMTLRRIQSMVSTS
jgi:N4-gp56 family major capsid protein